MSEAKDYAAGWNTGLAEADRRVLAHMDDLVWMKNRALYFATDTDREYQRGYWDAILHMNEAPDA